jgi:serine/threonine-protein kinase RsbW
MKEELHVDINIGSRFDNIDLVDVVTEAVLRHSGMDDESVERLGLAIREAVANGVQHGNKEQPEKRVTVSFVLEKKEVSIRIQDQGEGFDLDGLPDPLAPENLFKPRGRGILLMNSFMDEVNFEFDGDQGTAVTLRKRVTPTDPEADKEDLG